MAGTHPPTMGDLREECAMLRQRVGHLEDEKARLEAQVREWKAWYAQTYRPQIEYLDSEMTRLCAFAPQKSRSPGATGASFSGASLKSLGPAMAAPPLLRRGASEPRLRRKLGAPGSR
eukprot:SRR837773.6862.p2 GENE.SRR837773.6862~~SRR837773.6862.p2  ORF type:complete len:118 (-),score=30.29 SRR837773.6862:89-442(-)